MLPQPHAELGDAIRRDFTPIWVGWATCYRKDTHSYLSDAPGTSARAPAYPFTDSAFWSMSGTLCFFIFSSVQAVQLNLTALTELN